MFSNYDLHNHSTASDGTLSPTELVTMAAAAGVRVLALTDHDTTGGVAEAQRAAGRMGITLVPGVEISVTWDSQTIHILGLNLDITNQRLQQGLAGLREFRAATGGTDRLESGTGRYFRCLCRCSRRFPTGV